MRAGAWLFSYALLGLTQNGLAPILLPLVARSASTAGLTYAAFALSGLVAPVLGTWGDRTGRHRDLLIWGTVVAGVLFLLFATVGGPVRIALAAGAGLGAMAATTAGNVLAIQGRPVADWDDRVARLQRFISAGQVIGLVLAGVLVRRHPGDGFICAGLALLVAAALAWGSAPARMPRDPRDKPAPKPLVGGEAGVPGPRHHVHHIGWQEMRAYLAVIPRPLWRLLIIWLVAYPAMNGIATLFPVVMTHRYGMDPLWPSAAYAVGVAVSLPVYAPAGMTAHRRGGSFVLMTGFGARFVLLAGLTALAFAHAVWAAALVLVGFALIQVAWPLLSVGANLLSVRLAPAARGEAVGLFNAATSLASSVGSALAGVIFGLYGFAALAGVTCLTVGIALVLSVQWLSATRVASGG